MTAPTRSASHKLLIALAPLAWFGLLVLGFALEADEDGYGTHEQLGLPGCTAMTWLGVPCPGCGVTTSVTHVAQGRPVEAFLTQPFGLLVALVLLVYPVFAFRVHRRGGDVLDAIFDLLTLRRALGLLAFLLAAWVYKLVLVLG